MRAGIMRHRVIIEERTDVADGRGEVVGVWNEVATVWASVEPLVGREMVEASADLITFNTRIRLRYGTRVTERMRVKWENHIYDVESVTEPYSNRRELVLLCREVIET